MHVILLIPALLIAFLLAMNLVNAGMRLLQRHASGQPNARSIQRRTVAQSGGIALVAIYAGNRRRRVNRLRKIPGMTAAHLLATGNALQALIGAWDDVYPMLNTARLTPEKLLGRPGVALEMEGIATFIRNRVIVAQGVGGSIGSEFVRQIKSFNATCIPFLDLFVPPQFEREPPRCG